MTDRIDLSPVQPQQPDPEGMPPDGPFAATRAAAALAMVEPRLAEVPPEHIVTITVDVSQAASMVLGVVPGLVELRSEIVSQLPQFDVGHLDHLEDYALAAWYAHVLWLAENGPGNPVKPLLAEATVLRTNLLRDAEALAGRGLVDADTVADIRAGQGHLDTANDLVALSALFIKSWPAIVGKTAATEQEVRRAGDLGVLLLTALGIRKHGAAPAATDAAERRVRAFALFVHAYDQVRRAVHYLRWDHGDADKLAPSIYKVRGGGRSPRAEAPEAAASAAPAEGPASAVTAEGPASAAPEAPASAATPAAPTSASNPA